MAGSDSGVSGSTDSGNAEGIARSECRPYPGDPSTSPPDAEQSGAKPFAGPALKGTMTAKDIVFSVLAFNAPLAVFVGYLTVIMGFGNGLGAPVAFIATGALIFIFAAGFTTMSKHLPNPGAFYAYVSAGLGKPLGLGTAFLAIISYVMIYAGTLIFGGTSLNSLVTTVFNGPDIPWWAFYIALIVVAGVLGYFRITLSARILTVTMIFELLAVVAYDAVVFSTGGTEGLTSSSLSPTEIVSGSVGLAALYAIGMFGGFEATAIYREEARDPHRTIPRATYITIAVITVLYTISTYALIVGIGPSTVVEATAADPTGTALSSVSAFLGTVVQDLVIVLLCTSIFACVLSVHNITARYLFSLGRDGVIPRSLGKVHPSHGSPFIASFCTTAITVVFLIFLMISQADNLTVYALLVGLGMYALIMLLTLTSGAIFMYFRAQPGHGLSRWKTKLSPILAGIGFVGALVLATQNAPFLVGGSKVTATLLIAMYFGAMIIGALYALVLRRKKPDVYARIGRQDV